MKTYTSITKLVKIVNTLQHIVRSAHLWTLYLWPDFLNVYKWIIWDLFENQNVVNDGFYWLLIHSVGSAKHLHCLMQMPWPQQKCYIQKFFTRYGAPRHLLSNRGANFLSFLVQALCDIFSVHRVKTSSYHPASNSKCEKFNTFINKSLRTMVDESQENWPEILPGIMMAYRSTQARSTQISPYFLRFAKEMTIPIETQINPDLTEVTPNYRDTLKSFIDNVRVARQIAHENILRNQQHMKQYYDRNSSLPKYKLGDIVWLHDPTTPVGFSRKLKLRWRGPYRISEIGPNATYKLRHYNTDLPTDTLINAQRIKPAFLPWESRIKAWRPW